MTVAIRQLSVPRHHRLITQGQNVNMLAEIADVGLTSVLTDTAHVPTLSLFDPLDAVLVSNGDMTRLSTGVYHYSYQTSSSNPLGIYTANVLARNTVDAARLERIVVFKIVREADTALALDTFNYFAIKDQTGAIWYWYIAEDNTVNFSPTIPAVLGKLAEAVVITPIPYWLQLTNAAPATRYLYPYVTGELTVSATVPATGTGLVGSPELQAVSGTTFTLDLNILDEVILDEV